MVPLKENHALSRQRWTCQTSTRSYKGGHPPPLELMFRGSEGLQRRLQSHGDGLEHVWLTVVTSPKGSYREVDVLNYLDKHLERCARAKPQHFFLRTVAAELCITDCCTVRPKGSSQLKARDTLEAAYVSMASEYHGDVEILINTSSCGQLSAL